MNLSISLFAEMLKDKLSKREYRALIEFKNRLSEKMGENVLALELFGSKARGDAREDSDIDVLIVLRKGGKREKDFILDLSVDILLEYGLDISPHVFSEVTIKEFKKIPSVFLQVIERESIPIL